MNLDDLDIIYISTPMTKEERIDLLKKFQQAAFLLGIDKGAFLESCKIERFNNYKARKMRKHMHELVDYINDQMEAGIKRFKRRKYRGRYKYPKKKSKPTFVTSPPIITTILPSWMVENTQTNG